MVEGWTLYSRTLQVNTISSVVKVDLCDSVGTIITGAGYAQGSIDIGAADVSGQRKNTSAQRWADTTTSWGSPTHVKFADASGNVLGLFQIQVITGSMPIGDVTEYANIAIGQVVFG